MLKENFLCKKKKKQTLAFPIYRVWETYKIFIPLGVTISRFRLLNNKENCHFSGILSVYPSFRVGGVIQRWGGREAVQLLALGRWLGLEGERVVIRY